MKGEWNMQNDDKTSVGDMVNKTESFEELFKILMEAEEIRGSNGVVYDSEDIIASINILRDAIKFEELFKILSGEIDKRKIHELIIQITRKENIRTKVIEFIAKEDKKILS
jgi:hypothetical protein